MKIRLSFHAALAVCLGWPALGQEPTVSAPDSIVVDGVPAISQSAAKAMRAYGAYRYATFADWHPSSASMLVSTRFGNTPQLHLVLAPGAARRQLTFEEDAVSDARFGPSGSDYLVFAKDVGGGEKYQLYRYEMRSGHVTLLTDGKSRNLIGPFANHGDALAYTSTRRNGKDTDLWVVSPPDPRSDHLVVQLAGGGWQPLDWAPDDSKILLQEAISVNEASLWLVDPKTGEKTRLTAQDPGQKVSYAYAQFSRDGKGIYASTDKDSEFLRLAYIPLDTRKPNYLTTEHPWDVEALDVSQDGKRIALVLNENGQSVLYALSIRNNKLTRLQHLPAGVIDAVHWHHNGHLLAISMSNANMPGDVFSFDADTGAVSRWTESETGVPATDFQPAELMQWTSFDGRKLSGFLYKPPLKFSGPRPVLVLIHGGPEAQARNEWLGRLNYLLNEMGVAILAPNVRGSTGYGKSFTQLDNGYLRENAYKDVNSLFDWIATQPGLDARRIAVMGGSYGGHMTLAVSTFYSDRVRCSVDDFGMSNLVTFLEHTESYRQDLRRVEYGDERDPQMRAFLERIAPMNNVEKLKKPLLVVAGKNDPRVPVTESDQIVGALKKQGTPVWYVMAKDEGHGYIREVNRDYLGYVLAAFFQRYLLN